VAGAGAIDGTGNTFGNTIVGNQSDNEIRGLDGEDLLKGAGGADDLRGGNHNDTLYGGSGDDQLRGDGGDDHMIGGANNDTYLVNSLGDIVDELVNQGVDTVVVIGLDDYTLAADVENLTLATGVNGTGNNLGNVITGNLLDNVLDGAAGADTMDGRVGDDTYIVDNAGDAVVEFGGQGVDEVRTSVSYTLTAGADVETLRTTNDNGTAAIDLTGNTSGNQIIGNNGANTLDGRGGNDQLVGRGGNDTYIVDSASDTITENGGQGSDTVRTSVSYALTAGADVETLETTNSSGTAAINLAGNDSGNIVRGNNGDNTISGGGGDDTLTGFGGEDLFFFNSALDPAFNVDVITDFSLADDTIVLENAVFTALAVPGSLARSLTAAEFVIGTAAQDASDRIIYDSSTGALLYDSDGAGGVAAIQFAEVSAGLALSQQDFLVL
jgi:Ca2+-binding RTX toxin-like protein